MSEVKNELRGALVGLGATITEAMNKEEGFVPCGHPAAAVNDAIEALTSNASDEALAQHAATVKNFIEHVSGNHDVEPHDVADVTKFSDVKQELSAKLHEVSAKLNATGEHMPEVSDWIYRSLAALEEKGDDGAAVMLSKVEDTLKKLGE